MHETPINQAAGLQGLVQPCGPRIMAMVSHGDEGAELPLLWRLCWTLADFGYTVTVLDATTFESESNPGLDQLFENPYLHSETRSDAPEWLVPMVGQCGITPLLVVTPEKASLLSSYRALKRLLIGGQLEPTIVNITQPSHDASTRLRHVPAGAASLVTCAKNFLNYDVKTITLASNEEHASHTMQRLALRLMEGAVSLGETSATMGQWIANNHLTGMDRFAGSH